jgi:hypothetical protein
MSSMSLSDWESLRDEYKTAIIKVLSRQSYSIAGRSIGFADLSTLRDGLQECEREIKRLTRGGIRVRGATPC